MSRLASILYIVSCIAATRAASSLPVSTQPILTTSIVTVASDALSTSISTFEATSTVVLYSTLISDRRIITTSIGETLSTITSTSAVVTSAPGTELSTIVSTIDSTTIYSLVSSTTLPSSSVAAPTSSSFIPTPLATTPIQTTQVNIVTSTASLASASTSLATTSPPAASIAISSTSTATPKKSSKKKLSGGAVAGITIAVLLITGVITGALFILIGKHRRQKKWGRKAALEAEYGESKTNLFSPDARAGYDSMWKKPVDVSEKEIRPETTTPTEARDSPVSHERGDSATLGMDAPAIAGIIKNDPFEVKSMKKPVPNFSTPDRRSGSITALPNFT